MRRVLAALAALGIAFCTQAEVLAQEVATATTTAVPEQPEDDGVGLEPLGSFFSRFEIREHYSQVGLERSDAIRYRARFGATTTPIGLSDRLRLRLRFLPQASGFWHVGGDTTEDASLNVHEAAIQLEGDLVKGEVGRFEMVYGDHLVIGNVDWHPTARSFDGLRLRFSPGTSGAWADFFFTVLTEGIVEPYGEPFGSGDLYFTGLYADFGPLLTQGFVWEGYLLSRIAPETEELDREGAADLTLGTRVKNRAGVLDYRLETGVQFGSRLAAAAGENPDVFAYQADVEIGFNLLEADRLRFGLEGFFASGDDPETEDIEAWDQLYPTSHKWLGFADVIGARTNIAGGVLHLVYRPADPWRLSADGHFFLRPEQPDDVDSYVGTEVDIGARYGFGPGAGIRAGYSVFLPNDEATYGEDPLHFAEVELRYDLR